MGLNSFSGFILLAIGGLCSATNFIPFRQIKRWSWEVYWIVQALVAWVIAPAVLAWLFVPHVFGILREAFQADPRGIAIIFLLGLLWGVGGMAFGLAVRYLGIAQGYAIAAGVFVACAALAPLDGHGSAGTLLHASAGRLAMSGAIVCILGIALCAAAARRKDAEMTPEVKLEAGERDYDSRRGILMAALAGFMGCFMVIGMNAGGAITKQAGAELMASGRLGTWAILPVLAVMLWGGFVTNLIWSAVLIAKNGSAKQFAGEPGINPMRYAATSGDTLVDFDPLDPSTYDRLAPSTLMANYLLAAAAGGLWCLQLVFYCLGCAKIGGAPWGVQLALTVLFAALWGIALREWHGTGARTKLLAALGIGLLVVCTFAMGLGV